MELTFKTKRGRFNFRVGAIIIHNGNVLMVRNDRAPYFYTVGGRVKYDETCDDAIRREVGEELGVTLEIEKPVFLHESFFDEMTTKEHFHEVSLYYLMKKPDNIDEIVCRSVEEKGRKEELVWLPIDRYGQFEAYPIFFAVELAHLPDCLKHIVEIREKG